MTKKIERKFKKGDKVLVKAIVMTKKTYRLPLGGGLEWTKKTVLRDIPFQPEIGTPRPFMRYEINKSFPGVVVGWSTRISGLYTNHNIEYAPDGDSWESVGILTKTQVHTVIMVCPMTSERWQPPIACLEEDLDKLS